MQEPRPSSLFDAHPYLRQTLDLVADKWVVAVLYILSHGTKRYGELQREIGDISQRMLTGLVIAAELNSAEQSPTPVL
jgi:DNA-binding HxlR family transcriptional regulator